MTSPKFCLTLALALPLTAAHAAPTEHHLDTASSLAGTLLVALLGEPTIPTMPAVTTAEHVQPVSAGVLDTVPDVPEAAAFHIPTVAGRLQYKDFQDEAADAKLPDEPGMLSLIEASPIGGVARRIQAQRFNTDDGVSANDFAICYRLNRRSSVQVIPGDPAPVKMPINSFANNAGVTVGMVVRLSR